MRFIITLVLVALLAACGTSTATLSFGDEKNPQRVTAVSGLKSHDAANVLGYTAYTDAQIKKPQKAVCSLKAAAGKELKIDGLSEFTCWAPETDQMVRPVQADGEAMQAAKAIREAVGGTVKDATPVLLGGMALSDRKSARASTERIANTEAETQRQAIAAQQAQNAALAGLVQSSQQQAIDAAREAGAASAALPE